MATHTLSCSFCRKTEHQVRKLVAGPGLYICDECVEIASRIIQSEGPPPARRPWFRRAAARLRTSLSRLRPRSWSLGRAPSA
jgi:hypothetical protein